MSSVAKQRLAEERKAWRKDHPPGFVAKPVTLEDGTVDMFTWKCLVPGKEGTDWEGGFYPVTMIFSNEYPNEPPLCSLPRGFFHPNVYPTGKICLSIINDYQDWKPSISHKQILMGIQELLDTPYLGSPAQTPAFEMCQRSPSSYKQRVREQARKFPLPDD